jgi:hypothetical protein
MDLHNQIPVLIADVLETDVAQDTGIVDQDVYPTECIDGRANDIFAILGNIVVVGYGTATVLFDETNDLVCSLRDSN